MRPALGIYIAAGLCGLLVAGCAQTRRAKPQVAVEPAPICADFSFPIYFENNSDQLGAAAMQVIGDGAARVRGCDIQRVELLGLADATGSARTNLEISRRRAASVAEALVAAGLPRPAFDIGAAGQSGALTPAGAPEPLRRRTEVVIRARPKAP
jgi:peptidoglycan-associated lipoprotein